MKKHYKEIMKIFASFSRNHFSKYAFQYYIVTSFYYCLMSPPHFNKSLQKLFFRNLVSTATVLEKPLSFKKMNSNENHTSQNLGGGTNKYIFPFRHPLYFSVT